MKRTMILMFSVMAMLIMFVSCQVETELVPDEQVLAAETRSVVTRAPAKQNVTATVTLYQDYLNVVTQDMGSSHHHKTLEETLTSLGMVYPQYDPYGVFSDWDLISGAQVVMSNETNYNLDGELTAEGYPIPGTGTFDLWGSNHSSITFIKEGVPVLTLRANGRIEGNLLTGAEISMNWNVAEDYGNRVKATGKITGTFNWVFPDGDPWGGCPRGTFTLTGSIR
ncbi:MAG: hypothetical protein JXK93_09155 [Sphaerochaetaceae bacterium]|nr:hypothetical protein [Sphaerochaetaceae bacterium]